MIEQDDNSNKTKIVVESNKKRYYWIDMARGFTIIYMIITIIVPGDWFKGNPIFEFLFVHPPRVAGAMRLIDVGAPAFIFILGLLFSVTFLKRKEREGTKKAVLHIIKRYGFIFLLGLIIILATYDGFIYETSDKWVNDGSRITVVASDVIFVLGLVGFVGLPFLFLNKKNRIISAYILILIFSILCLLNDYTKIINFSVSSVHLGIFAAIFGYGAIQILGSAVGEYIFTITDNNRKKFYMQYVIFGIINLIIGLVLLPWDLTFLTGLVLTAIGATIIGSIIFILIDEKLNYKSDILISFGENPFLVYVLTAIPWALVYEFYDAPDEFNWILFIIIIVFFVTLGIFLIQMHKRNKIISTQKIAAVTLVVVIILAGILIPLDLI